MKQPVAIIIARGGSKRLPRKNVLPFCGKPLVEWSIIQACCSHSLGPENTYLSTDDDEIAAIGEKHNIHIIRRPEREDADELAATFWIRHADKEIRKEREIDTHLHILPTCPMRLSDDMDRIITRYEELRAKYPDCREVIWTVPKQEISIKKAMDEDRMMLYLADWTGCFSMAGNWANINDVDYYCNSFLTVKDSEVHDSAHWMEPGGYGRMMYYIEGQWFQQFDIDDQADFDFCELLMERYVLKGRGAQIYWDYKDGQK